MGRRCRNDAQQRVSARGREPGFASMHVSRQRCALITISFEDQAMHDACVALARAEQLYGSVSAAALVNLLAEAAAFENVAELMGFRGDMEISDEDSLCVSLGSDYHATFVVAGTRFRRDAGGRVVWATVTRLKLVQISRLP